MVGGDEEIDRRRRSTKKLRPSRPSIRSYEALFLALCVLVLVSVASRSHRGIRVAHVLSRRDQELPATSTTKARAKAETSPRPPPSSPSSSLPSPHERERQVPCSRGVLAAAVGEFCCAESFVCGVGGRAGKGEATGGSGVSGRRGGPAGSSRGGGGAPLSIPCSAVNDDYCDCPDGSDEPGTSACAASPGARFACRVGGGNGGSKGQASSAAASSSSSSAAAAAAGPVLLIPTSFVGDGVADCPEGDDEEGVGGVVEGWRAS